jgi:acetyltransferase-like isoleucine patch superfamily enzyme
VRGVRIAPYVVINTVDHSFDNTSERIMNQGYTCAKVIIEDDVWIGSHVCINKGVTIGKGCVIGSGSVVTKNIPPYSIAVGVPCCVIKKR